MTGLVNGKIILRALSVPRLNLIRLRFTTVPYSRGSSCSTQSNSNGVNSPSPFPLIDHRMTTITTLAVTTYSQVPITALLNSAVNTFRNHSRSRCSLYQYWSYLEPPAVMEWPPSTAAYRWPQIIHTAGTSPPVSNSPPRAWAVTPAKCAPIWPPAPPKMK